MPSWFNKVFVGKTSAPPAGPATVQRRNPILDDEEFQQEADAPRPERAKTRRVIVPTILPDEDPEPLVEGRIRIKVKPGADARTSVFLVDRPLVHGGYSAWFTNQDEAAGNSPLAEAIFELPTVESVQFHEATLTVARDAYAREGWQELAVKIGAIVRRHLEDGVPTLTQEFLDALPPEDVVRDRLQQIVETEVNPSIAGHSGAIVLERVEQNTVFLRMLGGCQGCAASTITLKQGIHQAFRAAVPTVGAILDVTEHAAGTNPFYKELPRGMADA